MALLNEHGRSLPIPESENDENAEPEPDHLADIHAVIRAEMRVRTQIVLRRLAELNPEKYADWSFQDLAEALATGGIAARKSDGVMVVRTVDVARALTERDEDDDDDNG